MLKKGEYKEKIIVDMNDYWKRMYNLDNGD